MQGYFGPEKFLHRSLCKEKLTGMNRDCPKLNLTRKIKQLRVHRLRSLREKDNLIFGNSAYSPYINRDSFFLRGIQQLLYPMHLLPMSPLSLK